MSSAEISAMNGAFQQQYMMGMQMSGMVGSPMPQGYGSSPTSQAEGIAGGGLSRAYGIGGAMATGGMALMGMDPFSLAMRGGIGAYGAGAGLGGAAMAGLGVAAPMAAGMAGIGYMGNQMMTGAQQSQTFNQNMRSSFMFRNPAAFGGRGFGDQGIRAIGGEMRGMVGAQGMGGGFGDQGMGAGGGFVGFEELGRLAANMGRMGMAQGVRNAKEFTEKFREMIKTVKSIAEDMGTTLEEAQTAMAAMKGSGIFKGQAGVAGRIRQGAAAGGLATTELTSMMNVGSQMARMVGGRGRSGAMGGIESITQIGTALQTGAISEEDVYNATGLTGAEGRQALAMQQLQRTGSFLKSAKGRYFLASVAGKRGELDAAGVANWMAGDMGVGDTQRQAYKNLAGVGRADFIRNEGRLRGAVMEQFGGLAPAMAIQQWAQGRGIDVSVENDRAMLFAQRQLGMGRDEADVAIKMASRLPEIMRERRAAREDDTIIRERALRSEQTGLKGIENRFNRAKDSINNEMQKTGQRIMEGLTDQVTEWANRLAGVYEETGIEGTREIARAAGMGGAGGKALREQLVGGGIRGAITDPRLTRAMDKSTILTGGEGGRIPIEQQARREKVQDLALQARLGELSGGSEIAASFAKRNRDELRTLYLNEGLTGMQGEDRLARFRKLMKEKGGKSSFVSMSQEFLKQGITEGEQARLLGQVEGEILPEGARLADALRDPGLPSITGKGPTSAAVRQEEMGRKLLGIDTGGWSRAAGFAAKTIGAGAFGALIGGAGGGDLITSLVTGGKSGLQQLLGGLGGAAERVTEAVSGRTGMAKGGAKWLEGAAGQKAAFGVMTGQKDVRESVEDEIMSLRSREKELSDEQKGQLGTMERLLVAADLQKATSREDQDKIKARYARAMSLTAGREVSPDEVDLQQVIAGSGDLLKAAAAGREKMVAQIATETRTRGREQVQEFTVAGMAQKSRMTAADFGVGEGEFQRMLKTGKVDPNRLYLSKATSEDLMKQGGAEAVQAAQMALQLAQDAANIPPEGAARDAALNRLWERQGTMYENMAGMSTKALRGLARGTAGMEIGGQASEILQRGARMDASMRKFQGAKGGRAAGAVGGVASALGLGGAFAKEEMAGLATLDPTAAAERLAGKLGIRRTDRDSGGGDFVAGIEESLKTLRGDTGLKGREAANKGAALLDRAIQQAPDEIKKKVASAQGQKEDPMEKLTTLMEKGNGFLKNIESINKKMAATMGVVATNTAEGGGDGESSGGYSKGGGKGG